MKRKTQVWELMSHPVRELSESTGIREAAEALHTWGITGAPVVDGHGKVVGVLSLRDLAVCLAARLLKLPTLFPTLDGPGDPDDDCITCPALEDLESARVSDLMTRGVHYVDPDSPIPEAIRLMRQHAIHRVFVRKGRGPVKGVITTADILRWVEEDQADRRPRRSTA